MIVEPEGGERLTSKSMWRKATFYIAVKERRQIPTLLLVISYLSDFTAQKLIFYHAIKETAFRDDSVRDKFFIDRLRHANILIDVFIMKFYLKVVRLWIVPNGINP